MSFVSGFLRGITPDPVLMVWEWADKYRLLDSKGSAEPGRYSTDRTPYLRKVMEDLSPTSPIRKIVVQKGAQTGFTECGLNWIGAVIGHFPTSMLIVFPTVEVAVRTVKQRINPMIANIPQLSYLLNEENKRGDALLFKNFPAGVVIIGGANSPASLASMPICYMMADEVDRMESNVGGEGDPIKLAMRRTATYGRRSKVYIVSTPTEEGDSRVADEFQRTNQCYYFVPCPHCSEMQTLEWEQMKWNSTEDYWMVCKGCGKEIREHWKTQMLAKGEWRATAEGHPYEVGYHLNSLYSPLGWYSWGDAIKDFLEAIGNPLYMRGWLNTVLGKTYKVDEEEKISWQMIAERNAKGWETLPEGILVITAGIDVQRDWLAVQIIGWGIEEESWSLDWLKIEGDLTQPDIWHELDEVLSRTFGTKEGKQLGISASCIDTGYYTDVVLAYVNQRPGMNIFATKGLSLAGKAIINPPSKNNRFSLNVYGIGTDTAKEVLFRRFRLAQAGPGYCHFPATREDSYFQSLVSEKLIVSFKNGVLTRVWKKIYQRNEALDTFIENMAALRRINLKSIQMTILPKDEKQIQQQFFPPEAGTAVKKQPRKQSIVFEGVG